MTTPNPMASLPPPPQVSMKTVPMAGILVDVYGLAELEEMHGGVSLLWLHHPRLRRKEDMADIAARAVAACRAAGQRLIALAFDQRNHGIRLVAPLANEAWRQGNPTHAQDMFGVIAGTVADTRGLMDLVEGYLFPGAPAGATAVQHLFLGVSLGGHTGWQLMFADERVRAGVLVVGCPDFMGLLSDRARLSKLETYQASDAGASFLGSKDFPHSLLEACLKSDPKAMLFGTGVPDWTFPVAGNAAAVIPQMKLEAQKLAGKRFLVCSGADDKLVPYRTFEPFMACLKKAAEELPDQGLMVRDIVYPGTGHLFSEEMVKDALRFIVDSVYILHDDTRSKAPPRGLQPEALRGKW